MNIPYSKKELYRDNQQMRKELEALIAQNAELVILMEKSKKLVDETNERINQHNKRLEKNESNNSEDHF